MSIIAYEHTWTINGLSNSERLILLAIADHHNKQTGRCDPGYKLLCEKTRMTRRNVIRLVKSLEEKDAMKVTRRKSEPDQNLSNFYSFPGLKGGDKLGNKIKGGGDKLGKGVVTNSVEKHTENVTQTGIEPEEGTGIPADKPQGKSSTLENTEQGKEKGIQIGKELAHQIYTVWENGLRKYQTTTPILTAKEKRQLKDTARKIIELGADPLPTIQKAVLEWKRFVCFVKGTGAAFTFNHLPDTGQLVRFARQAVDYALKEEHDEAAQKSWQAKQAKRKADAQAEAERLSQLGRDRDEFIQDFMQADPKYRTLSEQLEHHLAKKSAPDFGMTESDCLMDMCGDEIAVEPEQAWKQIRIDLEDELATYVRESDLNTQAEQALFVEDAKAA